MQSTRQITKAMELVAASKLRSAQAKAISSRPYFQTLYAAMDEIADTNNDFTSPYLHANPNGKPAYVVIAGDRGLAGGYNNNILKLAYSQMEEGAAVLPIGKKAVEYFKRTASSIFPSFKSVRRWVELTVTPSSFTSPMTSQPRPSARHFSVSRSAFPKPRAPK